jgi:hypothetical protein
MSSSDSASAIDSWSNRRRDFSDLCLGGLLRTQAIIAALPKEKDSRIAAMACRQNFEDIALAMLVLTDKISEYAQTQNELDTLLSDLSLYATDLLRENKAYFDALVSAAANKEE